MATSRALMERTPESLNWVSPSQFTRNRKASWLTRMGFARSSRARTRRPRRIPAPAGAAGRARSTIRARSPPRLGVRRGRFRSGRGSPQPNPRQAGAHPWSRSRWSRRAGIPGDRRRRPCSRARRPGSGSSHSRSSNLGGVNWNTSTPEPSGLHAARSNVARSNVARSNVARGEVVARTAAWATVIPRSSSPYR